MAKVDGSLGSLVQGVSQQPSRARLPGQAEDQVNVLNDEVFGMSRRPSTELVGNFEQFDADLNGDRIVEHGTLKMKGKRMPYMLRVDDVSPEMKILDDGVEYLVDIDPDSLEYMKLDTAKDNPYGRRMLFKEMDDTVFVLNTQRETAMSTDLPVYSDLNSTIVYCRGGQYAVGFTIRFEIDGEVLDHHVTYSTPDGEISEDTPRAQVKYITRQLFLLSTLVPEGTAGNNPLNPISIPASDSSWIPDEGTYYASENAQSVLSTHFDITMVGEYIVFTPLVSTLDYTITATETTGSELLVAVKDTVDDLGRLPTRAPVGHIVKVVGSNRAEDDFYMTWVLEGRALNTIHDVKGVWEECTAAGEVFKLDPETMPQELYKDDLDVYRIRQLEWDERAAGNNQSNPIPKFIGETLQDIADFQGRAVFLHDSSVSMSQSDEYRNWFKQTASTKLATDPIHLRSTSTQGESSMVYAVPFNRDLILIGSNNSQYMITGRSTLTTDNASITLTAEFEIDLHTRPQPLGDSVMFASFTGKFSHVHEMYLQSDADSHGRRTVTDHVPRYIEGAPSVFAADDGSNTAVIVGEDGKTLYVYEFLWLDNSRVQSAWNKWTFSSDIVHARIDEGILHMTLKSDAGGYSLVVARLYRQDTSGLEHSVHLDISDSHLVDGTEVTVPYSGDLSDLSNIVLVQVGSGDYVSGELVPVLSVVDNTTSSVNTALVTLKTSVTGVLLSGTRFVTRLVPTMPYLRDSDGVAITGAELAVSDFTLTFTDTGPFSMIRECSYENAEDYWQLDYSGRTLGDPQFILGSVPMDSDKVEFPFEDQTSTSKLVVVCDTHLPLTLTEIEWRGSARNRSRRITNGG